MSACFYTGSNYQGENECLTKGQYNNVKHNDRYTSAKIPPNLIAFLYEHPNFEGEYLRLDTNTPKFQKLDDNVSSIKILPDCHNPKYTWEPECEYNRNLFDQLDTTRADFCNANRTNAISQKCMSWCNENKGKCATLNKEVACNKYNIPQSECSDEKIMNLEKNCIQYGLIDADSKTTTSRSIYQCNDKGIQALRDQCQKFNIEDDSECTAANIEDKLTEKLFQETSDKLVDTLEKQSKLGTEQREKASNKLLEYLQTSQEQSESTFSQISEANKAESNKQIDRAYSLLQNISSTNPPKPPNYTQTYIIVALICLILIILGTVIILFTRK